MSKKKVTLNIDSKTYKNFKKHCEENAIVLSKRVEIFMKNILKEKKLAIFFILGIFMMGFASALVTERGLNYNVFNNNTVTIYNNFINYNNGTGLNPINLTIYDSSDPLFNYEVNGTGFYGAFFNTDPTSGNAIKYVRNGTEILFQPGQLQYTNAISQIEAVSNVLSVTGTPQDNSFNYTNVYGSGISLRYIYLETLLKKELIIESFSDLPLPTLSSQVNISLKMNFNFVTNAPRLVVEGVDLLAGNNQITTTNAVEVQDASGKLIYFFPKPFAYDSNGSQQELTYIFKKQGPSLFIEVHTPYDWLNATERVYPVYIDPSLSIDTSQGGKDTYIEENKPDENSGSISYLQADSESNNREERILLDFNLTGIPQNSTISNAVLELYLLDGSGDDFNLTLYRVTKNWTENGATWNSYNGTDNWASAGGDYDLFDYDFDLINTTQGWRSWNVTTLIQELVNNTYENYGFILVPSTGTGNNWKQFASKENSDSALYPRLNITYTQSSIVNDNEYPIFSNFELNPVNNSVYSSGARYDFNVTVLSTNGTVGLEFDGVNYTATNLSATEYNVTLFDLNAGTSDYYFWSFGNGTNMNYNTSKEMHYTIAQSVSEVNLTLNNTKGNISIIQGNSILLNGTLIIGDNSGRILLYNNGTLINNNTVEASNNTLFNFVGLFNITVFYEGSQNYSESSETYWVNVTAVPDITNPEINIIYPLNITYQTNITLLNYTVSDLNLQSCWYSLDLGVTNNSVVCGNNVTGISSSEGSNTWIIWANDSFGNMNSSSVIFNVNSTGVKAPNVSIEYPSFASTYNGTNIPLNFSITNSSSLDSCWYTTNEGASNNTIPGCLNTYLNISDGYYNLTLYSNESLLGKKGIDSVSFYVNSGKPGIHLISLEDGKYTNSSQVNLTYIPSSDFSIVDCSLYGNFNGTYNLNQTNTNITQDSVNLFSVNPNEGNYNWSISCSDLSSTGITGNRTFYSDFTPPNVSENSISVTGSDVSFEYFINDSSPTTCTFNINLTSSGQIVFNNLTEQCNNLILQFNVSLSDGSYESVFEAEDSAGNVEKIINIINVDTSSGSIPGVGSNTGGSSPGSSSGLTGIANLELRGLETLNIRRGGTELVELEVQNIGSRFLNSCKLEAGSEISDWISNEQVESLSSGEIVDFIFSVNVPLDAEIRSYNSNLTMDCNEFDETIEFNVNIISGNFEIIILNSERIPGNRYRVEYSLENFLNSELNLDVNYYLRNLAGIDVVEGLEQVLVQRNAKENLFLEFDLPKDTVGSYDLILEASRGLEKNTAQQRIILSTPGGLTGLAVFGDNLRAISWFLGIILVLGLLYFVVKFIRKHKERLDRDDDEGRKFIRIDLRD